MVGAQLWATWAMGTPMPKGSGHGKLHQPHLQAKISKVEDQTILTSNKGWAFDLNGPPLANCKRCGQPHGQMFPCGAQGRASLLTASTADT